MAKAKAKDSAGGGSTIALNRKARHDYQLEDRFEAGIALQGWEVKSLRAGRAQISEAYIMLKNSEAFLFGALFQPLTSTSTHYISDPQRTRKLLLHRRELNQLIGAVERKGYTAIPTALYWKGSRAKLEFALAKGKQEHDKREAGKERDWQRQKERLMRRAR